MCLVKTLLGKTLWEKILVKEKEYTYFLIRTICCLIKNLVRKTQWEENLDQGKKSATRIVLPLIKTSLNFLWWCLQSSYIVVGIFLFKRKTTHFLNMVCHLSQPDALSTCFMEDFYFCIATFASLITRILLCLHMQTHSVLEIELYADQINILHLRNQSILSWIPRDRINP